MVEDTSNLTSSQRYAASALFAIALNQAQISQTNPPGIPDIDHGEGNGESDDRVPDRQLIAAVIVPLRTRITGSTRLRISSDPLSDVFRLIPLFGMVWRR